MSEIDLAEVRALRDAAGPDFALFDGRCRHVRASVRATLSLDSEINAKIVSDRIGHSDLSVTLQIYGHRSVGQDREAAELIAKLIREALDRPETA